jgi:hypothetical protein
MRLDADDFKKYPLCAHYIRQFLGNPDTYKSKYPNIWNAWVQACQIDWIRRPSRTFFGIAGRP